MTDGSDNPHQTSESYRRYGEWVALVIGLGFSALLIIEVTHYATLDICDPFHEPPTTILGFTVAILATAVPVAFGIWSRIGTLIKVASGIAVVECLFWWWFFVPVGSC